MCKPDGTPFQRRAAGITTAGNKTNMTIVIPSNNGTNEKAERLAPSPTSPSSPAKTLGGKLLQAKEDHMYAHKMLGFSALASYVYRFSHLGSRDGNFGPSLWTLAFVLHHLFLNLSSFVFAIPQRRISSGFRIWPEYRIHSLVFTSRNLACMGRLWVMQRYFFSSDADTTSPLWVFHVVSWVIVMTTCAAADYGSSLSRHNKSNTVRGTDYFEPYANWFASEMQFQMTAICLSGGYQRYSMHLVGAFVIQFNSFLMTLRRKNVFSHLALTTTYGIMLLGGLSIALYEDLHTDDKIMRISACGNFAIILRMGLRLNKYLVWTLLALIMYVVEEHSINDIPYLYWMLFFWMTKLAGLGMGLRRRSQVLQQRKSENTGNTFILAYVVFLSVQMGYDMLEAFEFFE